MPKSTSETAPSSYFSLHPRLQKEIVNSLGWRSLRPVQEVSIPPLLRRSDAVILAPTAGGKTESAYLPLLSRILSEHPGEGPHILYLCPLKALINNLLPRLQSLSAMVGLEAFAWHGEVSQNHRRRFLSAPASTLLTTPESLQVILTRQTIDQKVLFKNLLTVVVDEVHAFCGDPRGDHLSCLLTQLDHLAYRPVQRVGLSATVGNPGELLEWLSADRGCEKQLVDPTSVDGGKTPRLIEVHPVEGDLEACAGLLSHAMKRYQKNLLFVDSRAKSEKLQKLLGERGIDALAHHSSLSRELREDTEQVFKDQGKVQKKPCAIVCTSTLELGLDVGDIESVFQFGAPSTVSAFLQRLGRAGRRENQPARMMFVTHTDDDFLQVAALLKRAVAGQVEPVIPQRRAFGILAQQILLQILRHGALAVDKLWQAIEPMPPFSEVTTEERRELLRYLVEQDWLAFSQSRLRLGFKAEDEFGRGHFLDLMSVFEGGSAVTVKTKDGRAVGTLDFSAANNLATSGRSFLLGGGSWKSAQWNKRKGELVVVASLGGEPVRWSGGRGELSFEMIRTMRDILTDTDPLPFLGKGATEKLHELRRMFRYLEPDRPVVSHTSSGARVRTRVEQWAGSAVHRTLGAAVSGWLGCEHRFSDKWWEVEASETDYLDLLQRVKSEDRQTFLQGGLALYKGRRSLQGPEHKFLAFLPEPFREELEQNEFYDLNTAAVLWDELYL